ncbi:MAG: hypothetical protein R3D34_15860 [Nitratireductor sp.]
MADVQDASEEDLLHLASHLPPEAAEAVLEYAANVRLVRTFYVRRWSRAFHLMTLVYFAGHRNCLFVLMLSALRLVSRFETDMMWELLTAHWLG